MKLGRDCPTHVARFGNAIAHGNTQARSTTQSSSSLSVMSNMLAAPDTPLILTTPSGSP